MSKHTKIVCTIGPSCESVERISDMVQVGMNIARLNFSHGTYDNHAMLIEHIRQVEEQTNTPVGILQDLQGPKIRIGLMPDEGIDLQEGDSIIFDTAIDEFHDGVIPVGFKELHHHVKAGERILLNDGKSEVVITKVQGTTIHTTVNVGGNLTSHKGINVPDSSLHISALTDKDKKDLQFGVEHNVDMIAMSFVTTPEDILDLRYEIKNHEKTLGKSPLQPIRLIAKIERKEAVDNIDAILDVVDGIMVARGDLGVEMPAADVPLIQKQLIEKALAKAKPVIVATQMLDSMQENPRPTRAEVSDVANAVIDHADAVMLSNETATGKFPVETVDTMATIIRKTEASHYDDVPPPTYDGEHKETDELISGVSRILADASGAKLILVASLSGETGRLISRYRPDIPIVVSTASKRVMRQLALSHGVIPFQLPQCRTIEELVDRAINYLKQHDLVCPGESIIVVAGEPVGQAGHVNLVEIRTII